jgi:TP901 family phage tail tape measure protein
LGGRFSPAGFIAFDRAMMSSKAKSDAFTAGVVSSHANIERSSGRSMKAVSTGLTAAVAAAGVTAFALGKAVVKAASFEAGMRNVNSIAKVSEGNLKKLSDAVLVMAGRTGQAPKVLTGALYDLVSSGFDAKDAMVVLESSANAATAGLTDAGTSTKAIAAALNAYRLPAEQAGRVSDILFQTVNAGVITFEELAQNLADVTPFAASLGVPLEQVGAAIATITKAGVPAAQTTTEIKGIFNQMLKPSKALAGAIKETGASSGEALLKSKGFQGALEALIGTTDGSKAAMSKLFPDVEALAGALLLTGKNAKGARGDLATLRDSGGATGDALKEQSKSAESAGKKLSAAFDAAETIIGRELLPTLADQATKAAKGLNELAASGDLEKFGKDVATYMEGVVDAVTAATDAINALQEARKLFDPTKQIFDATRAPKAGDAATPYGLKIKVGAEGMDAVVQGFREIQGIKIDPKKIKAVADIDNPLAKFRALAGLNLPPKAMVIVADSANAEEAIRRLQGYLLGLRDKVIHIGVVQSGGAAPRPGSTSGTGHGGAAAASGMKTSGPQFALIGEGNGPEYVIPTEPRYRGRALGLLMQAAEDLGVAAFAKGTKKGKSKRHVPAASEYLRLSPEEFDGDVAALERTADNRDKKNKLTAGARKARRDLPAARALRKRAREHAAAIVKHDELAEIARQDMELADGRDDQKAYDKALGRRKKELARSGVLLRESLKFGKKGSKWSRDIQTRLGKVRLDEQDAATAVMGLPDAVDPQAFTEEERARLEQLGGDLALAELTATKDDDRSVLEQMLGVQEGALARVRGSGDGSLIKEVADAVKGTRDQLAGLTSAPDASADLQAQLAQANHRADVAQRTADIASASLSVLGSPAGMHPAGIGMQAPQIVFSSYVPPSPQQAVELGRHVTRGLGYQGSRRSSVDYLGV